MVISAVKHRPFCFAAGRGRGGKAGVSKEARSLLRCQRGVEGGEGVKGGEQSESTDDGRSVSSLTSVLNAKRPRSGREYQVSGNTRLPEIPGERDTR